MKDALYTKNNKFLCRVFCIMALSLFSCFSMAQVKIAGAMKNVMWKGQLYGTISLDTIGNRQHLYGVGPVEGLTGEILIVDGRAYKSVVVSDTEMRVEETFKIKAPFFVYGNVPEWKEQQLPEDVTTLPQLEAYLEKIMAAAKAPFVFKLEGVANSALIHIVNLPSGSKVSSPEEAHRGQVNYPLRDVPFEIVGFFSRHHQSVFTHHDTFMHLHLITTDRLKMGHLDAVEFKPGEVKLYLPQL